MSPATITQEYSYEVRQEGRLLNLLIHCKSCQGPTGLLNPQCLAVVLKILSVEHYADMITFSGNIQRQYTGESIEYLKRLVELAKLLDHLSLRSPLPFSAGVVFPEGQIDEVISELEQVAESRGTVVGPLLATEGGLGRIPPDVADKLARHAQAQKANVQRHLKRLDCPRCPFNPRNLFPQLSSLLMQDIRLFGNELGKRAQTLGRGQTDEGCSRCLGLTVADLQFLSEQMVDLANYLTMRGGEART
jgi:hypothetical protein